MPTFIKRKPVDIIVGVDALGDPEHVTDLRDYTSEELRDLAFSDGSRFFQVTETHAENVLRRQRNYQEVTGSDLETYRAAVLGVQTGDVRTEWERRADEESAGSRDRGAQAGDNTAGGAEATGAAGDGESAGAGVEPDTLGAGGPESGGATRATANVHPGRAPRRGTRKSKGRAS